MESGLLALTACNHIGCCRSFAAACHLLCLLEMSSLFLYTLCSRCSQSDQGQQLQSKLAVNLINQAQYAAFSLICRTWQNSGTGAELTGRFLCVAWLDVRGHAWCLQAARKCTMLVRTNPRRSEAMQTFDVERLSPRILRFTIACIDDVDSCRTVLKHVRYHIRRNTAKALTERHLLISRPAADLHCVCLSLHSLRDGESH